MTKALGEDKSQSVLSRIAPSTSARPIEILDWMDARSIAELISDEHPQIVALVVSYLDAGLGADVLGLLPEDMQAEVIRRIATLKTVGPDALRELEDVMQRKFKANTSLRATQVGGIDAAARIMNFTQQALEGRIMKDIAKGDKGLMLAIQESMFVFDTLIMSDDKSLQTLLRSVDTELLILALKGADEPLQEKLFSCMSKRAAANIMDEMEALGPVRLTEVQSAQKEIINVARRLWVIKQVILQLQCIKNIICLIKLANTNRLHGFEFEIFWTGIGEANVILRVVVSAPWNQAVISPKTQALS